MEAAGFVRCGWALFMVTVTVGVAAGGLTVGGVVGRGLMGRAGGVGGVGWFSVGLPSGGGRLADSAGIAVAVVDEVVVVTVAEALDERVAEGVGVCLRDRARKIRS